jgi:serine/threonine-protein kinase
MAKQADASPPADAMPVSRGAARARSIIADIALDHDRAEPAPFAHTDGMSYDASFDPLASGSAAQRRLGDYELLELIGEGGTGVVYRARQLSLDRDVAVKVLAAGPWASSEFVDRFQREAQNAARMQHPNIVAIYEVCSEEDLHFFSMQLVRGPSLAHEIRRQQRWPAQRAAALLRAVAEAVDYAHRLGVLHLDLKPGNVLLDQEGEPRVADFGLARRVDDAIDVEDAGMSGTPSYMAPEQVRADARAIAATTDVWGLGAILHELVTGEPPFRAASVRATLQQVEEGALRRPRQLVPTLPLDLEAIILRCLARDPAARYPSARALADDLGRFVEGYAVHARRLNGAQRILRWVRREPRLAGSVALIATSLVAGVLATGMQWQRAEANARHARESAQRAEAARRFLVAVFEQAAPDQTRGKAFTAHELLAGAETLLHDNTPADAATQVDLTGLIGTLYWDIGDYERSAAMLSQVAPAIDDTRLPADVRARILLGLARTELDKNRYDAAIEHAGEAQRLAATGTRIDATEAAEARRIHAEALVGQGNAKDAEPMLRVALAEDRAHFGELDRLVIDDLVALGYANKELSHFDEAVRLANEAAASATRKYGRNNSRVVNALELAASALGAQGRFSEAEAKLREAVELARTVFGPEHRETIVAQSNLLWTLERQGRFKEALGRRLELLETEKKIADPRPEQMAYAYNFLASDYLGLGRFVHAEQAAREAVAAWHKVHGSDEEWDSAESQQLLALALQGRGHYADSEAAWRDAIRIRTATESADSLWLNSARAGLGNLQRLQHRHAEARDSLRAATAALPTKDNPVRAAVLAQLAEAELDAGDAATAEARAKEALDISRKVLPPGNYRIASALYSLARSRVALGLAGDALPMLEEAQAMRAKVFEEPDLRRLELRVAKVEALAALQRPAEAELERASLEPLLRADATPYATDLLNRLEHGQGSKGARSD